jgi:hypothetical protein
LGPASVAIDSRLLSVFLAIWRRGAGHVITISIELFIRLDILFIELFIKIIIRLPSILVIYISRALEL